MDATQIILVSAALVFGCIVQGAVGFGAGLFAIPLMIWAGINLPAAITIVLLGVMMQCSWNLYRYRDHVSVRELLPLFMMRSLSLPVGIMLLGVLVGLGTARVKQAVGLMLLLALSIQWLGKVKPRDHVAGAWTVVAGGFSGLFAGLVGMGGPPVVMWVMAHDWPAKKSRSFLWATFLMLVPFNLTLLVYRFPDEVWGPMLLGLCLAPLTLAGSELGLRLGGLMNRHRLRAVALGLLVVLALSSILGPVLGDWG